MNKWAITIELLVATFKFRLSNGNLKALQKMIDLLEQVAVFAPNGASHFAKVVLESFARSINKQAGFDLDLEIDSDPEVWLKMRIVDDEFLQNILNLRERLRTIAMLDSPNLNNSHLRDY
jgi:hypothetical protein